MAKVKVGVIGVGKMGAFHANNLKVSKEAKLVGVYDKDAETAKLVAEKLKIKHYPSYELLLQDVEAVIIATPTPTHLELSRDCILAGKHVLIEKPLAENSKDAYTIVELAKVPPPAGRQNAKYMVGMIERFNPAFQKLLTEIKGRKIIGAELKRFSPYPERIKDSVVLDMMIHDLDLATKLSPVDLESIRAYGKKKISEKLDEVYATLYFKDGLIVKVNSSRLKPDKERKVLLTTEKAIYEADLLNKQLSRRQFDDLTKKTDICVNPADQISLEIRSFLRSIQNNSPTEVPLEQGARVLKIAEEVERIACS